jgi:hypothetical protein
MYLLIYLFLRHVFHNGFMCVSNTSNFYLFTFWEITGTEILDAVLKIPDALIFIVVYKILSVHGVGCWFWAFALFAAAWGSAIL